jgi:DNA-binding NtrC family response regulator
MESNRRRRVLIVDDDGAVQVSLALLLKQSGFEAVCADGPREALEQLSNGPVDLVLQDMNFSLQTSGEEGVELLARIKQAYPNLPVLLMTAWGSIALAVRGVKAGAANFFTKPWDNAQLVELIEATLQLGEAAPAAQRSTRAALDAKYDFEGIVGEHPKLLRVLETIAQVACTRAPVLILGESGTGKELIADAIHRNSPRASAPVVKINMGAITSSLFESEMFGHVRAISRAPTRAPCSSTRSASCSAATRSSCCACCRTSATSRSAPAVRSRPTCAWSRPPTANWRSWSRKASSARTCSIA